MGLVKRESTRYLRVPWGRWREFVLGDDPREKVARHGDWVEAKSSAQRRRLQREGARPARRRGRPLKPPPGQEGYFSQLYEVARGDGAKP